MLVDPRPYTYQYRKPRFSNPTFQSRNLYDSLYHQNRFQKNDYFTPREMSEVKNVERLEKMNRYNAPIEQQFLERNKSVQFSQKRYQDIKSNANEQKYKSSQRLPAINYTEKIRTDNNLASNLSGYGDRIMRRDQGLDRYKVYERQQIPFDIINCYPRENERHLRNFPKLTLEDKLLQRGTYNQFNNPEKK